MTAEQLVEATGMEPAAAARWLPHVEATVQRFGLLTPARLAMWLAQCGHESDGFRRLRENLNYSAAALRANWPRRFPTDELAAAFARKPEAIANKVYGGRMGNGPEGSGDGWRFRGRGPLEITGRANYRACGSALGVDLETVPELLETEHLGALSAGWYWQVRKLGPIADRGDVEAVTRVINGGTIGLEDRRARYARALQVLAPTAAEAA